MAVDYTPTLGDYKELKPFRYWCQKVLPLVYDDSLSYYELLCKVVDYLNKTMEDVETLHDDVDNLHEAYEQLQEYVNDYFDNLDVQSIINQKLDVMASDGTLSALISPFVPDLVANWLAENISPTTPAIDKTLSISGAGADSKVTGDEFTSVKNIIKNIASFLPISYNLVWEQGSISSTGAETTSDIRIRTDFVDITEVDTLRCIVDSGYVYQVSFYSARSITSFIADTGAWFTESRNISLQDNYKYARFILAKSGNVAIVPSDGSHLSVSGDYALRSEIINTLRYGGYINSANYQTELSDLNSALDNTFYVLRFTSGENLPAHMPFNQTETGYTDLLTLINIASTNYKQQFLFTRDGVFWVRSSGANVWGSWYTKSASTIHVGAGFTFTKLTDAIKYAFEHANTTVIVHEGTYNIITEMGEDYWTNFSSYSDLTHAMIGNNAHFIFSPDARVLCEYTGANTAVNELYSPFNSLYGSEGDFIIEGLKLVVSGCRYAIHDDVGASTVQQSHKYINCDIANDIRCIGGGLGANMDVEMRDCIFRSTGATGNTPVSWHNSGGGTTGKGTIRMTGCYVTGNGDNAVQFLAYGISPKQSRVLVSNNSFNAQPICRKFDETIQYMNFEMFAFNNEIRA